MRPQFPVLRKRSGRLLTDSINMSHGGGGKAMRDLIDDVFIGSFDNDYLNALEDQARVDLSAFTAHGDRLAFTTDSYVIDPIFFPGGDIGKLSVCGTVNDLAVGGAVPLFLSCAMVIEEGLAVDDLRKIVRSMKIAADAAGVKIVTGDTKVVNRGAADKVFINTTGVGVIPKHLKIDAGRAIPGDMIIVSGFVGDHGAAIMAARGDLSIEHDILSDCASLNGLISDLGAVCPDVHCMRDATRGGIATVLNEIAGCSNVCVRIRETAIPIRPEVRGMTEVLGLDPLYLANEGKVIIVVPSTQAEKALQTLRNSSSRLGVESAIIGRVCDSSEGIVVLETAFGGERIVDMLVGDQLPRIC